MSPGFRSLAPAGAPVPLRALVGGMQGVMQGASARAKALRELESALASFFGVPRVFMVSSARAALTLTLEEMRQRARGTVDPTDPARSPDRDEVLVPGYTCYSVAAAVHRAGLRIRPVDLDPATLDFDPEALAAADTSRVLALVSANLFGLPNDLPALERFALERGIALLDDAAQAMHARVGDRFAGAFGDAGVFSLDRGKVMTTMHGGILLVRERELAERLESRIAGLPRPGRLREARTVAEMGAYAAALHPRLFWVPERLLTLGETVFDPDFRMEGFPEGLAAAAARQIADLPRIEAARGSRAQALHAGLSDLGQGGSPPLRLPVAPDGTTASMVRFPVILAGAATRDRILQRLRDAGLGATGSYPQALVDAPALRDVLAPDVPDTPWSRRIAAGMLTLPTHHHVEHADLRRIVSEIRKEVEH